MNKSVRKMVYGALMITMGLLFPSIFHLFGAGGPMFLPMHIPVILGGLLLGPYYGLIIGVMTPVLSSLFTGMPPLFPTLPIMTMELACYGFVSGLVMQKTGKLLISQYAAMLAGRAGYALVFYFMLGVLGLQLPGSISVAAAVVTGLPGIALQLVLIPVLYKILERVMFHDRYTAT